MKFSIATVITLLSIAPAVLGTSGGGGCFAGTHDSIKNVWTFKGVSCGPS